MKKQVRAVGGPKTNWFAPTVGNTTPYPSVRAIYTLLHGWSQSSFIGHNVWNFKTALNNAKAAHIHLYSVLIHLASNTPGIQPANPHWDPTGQVAWHAAYPEKQPIPVNYYSHLRHPGRQAVQKGVYNQCRQPRELPPFMNIKKCSVRWPVEISCQPK